jgi:uncharacterized membrane protein
MDAFLVAAIGFLLLAIPVAMILGIVAWARSRRLLGLEGRLIQIERELKALRERPAPPPAERPIAAVVPPSPEPARAAVIPAPSPSPHAPSAEAQRVPAPVPPKPGPMAPFPTPKPAKRTSLEWERLLGVRGAAVVGGIVLALAGLLFVQHSIRQGWITPGLRVALAAGVGALSLALSEFWFRRGYAQAANALAGAGAVLLFGALWAGRALYGLFGFELAFPGMVAVSVVLGLLALRRPSTVVAVFGVVGGFVTPILLRLGSDRPLGLFGYLLALDIGLFALSRRRGWGGLGVLGALGSLIVFALYVGLYFDPSVAPLALVFVGATTLALCLPALAAARDAQRSPLAGAGVALAGSFPLALFVVARAGFDEALMPLALTCAVLQLLAGVVARRTGSSALAPGAALGTVALILTWSLKSPLDGAGCWQLLTAVSLLDLVPHALAEWDRRGKRAVSVVPAALTALGLAGVCVYAVLHAQGAPQLAVLGLALVPTALLVRQAWLAASRTVIVSAALVPGAIALALAFSGGRGLAQPLNWSFSVCLVGVTALFAWHAARVRPEALAPSAWIAVAASGLFGLAVLTVRAEVLVASPYELHLVGLALGALAARAAGRLGSAGLMVLAVLCTAASQYEWVDHALPTDPQAWIAVVLGLASCLAVCLGPRAPADDSSARSGPWVAAAFAPLAWLPALLRLCFDHGGVWVQPLPALLLALPALSIWARARRIPPSGAGSRLRMDAMAASAGVALALLALMPPLRWERGFFAAAFSAALLIALAWRRLPHRGLSVAAAALCIVGLAGLSVETVMVYGNLGERWPRSGWPVLHWMSYGWLIPALAALAAAALFGRARSLGREIWPARIAGVCGLLLLFIWINIEVQNLFMEGNEFFFTHERLPKRAAVTSCAWALYAFGLLVAGLRGGGAGLRKASLVFLMAAIAKVFLYDLGTLTGLYRVGSLVGLAVALFAVSLCYQRFVFKRAPPEPEVAAQAQT